jgi:hypothetical protein
MSTIRRYSTGQLIAAALVFFALLAVAVPANLKSRSKNRHRKVLRYIMAFQSAACTYQNTSPALRFFRDTREVADKGFPLMANNYGYNFSYVTDRTQLRFVFVAIPDDENSDDTAFYGDEMGTIYTTQISQAMRESLLPELMGVDKVRFDNEVDKRLPGDWVPY